MDRMDANQMETFAKVEREVTTALANDLRTYAVRRWPEMNHEWRKAKIASLLGMKVRRVRSYWDAEETLSPRLSEVERIKALIGQKEAADAADIALAKRISELEAQVAFLVAALASDEVAAKGASTNGARASASAASNSAPKRRAGDH